MLPWAAVAKVAQQRRKGIAFHRGEFCWSGFDGLMHVTSTTTEHLLDPQLNFSEHCACVPVCAYLDLSH